MNEVMGNWPSVFGHRRFGLLVLGLVAVVAAGWVLVVPGRGAGVPRLVLPLYRLELGEGKPDQILDGRFEIRNRGSAPLVFAITPSCGCSELRPTSGTLPPGDAQEIVVGVRLGTEVEKTVMLNITSNDPERSSVFHQVYVVCPTTLVATPGRVDFGRIAPGGSRSATVSVRGWKTGPSNDLGRVRFHSTNPRIRVERERSEPDELTLRVTLDQDAPVGYETGAIELRLGDEPRAVEVVVTADVAVPINVVPAAILWRNDLATGSLREENLIVWRSDGGLLGPLVESTLPPGVTIEEVTRVEDRVRRFRVRPSGPGQAAVSQIQMR